MAAKRRDDIWLTVISILFLVIIAVLLIIPKKYFAEQFDLQKSFDIYNQTSEMSVYDSKVDSLFASPSTLGTGFADANNFLITKRCYQFANTNIDSTIALFDTISRGPYFFDAGSVGIKETIDVYCKTYKLYVNSYDTIQHTVINDMQKLQTSTGQPVKGGVYVIITQIPYWRNYYNEYAPVTVKNNTWNLSSQSPYFDTKNVNPNNSMSSQYKNVVSTGNLFIYITIMYSSYSSSGQYTNNDSRLNSLINILDRLSLSKNAMCQMKCLGNSDLHCGCASTPINGQSITANGTMYSYSNQAACKGPVYSDGIQKYFRIPDSSQDIDSTFLMMYRVNTCYQALPPGVHQDQTKCKL